MLEGKQYGFNGEDYRSILHGLQQIGVWLL